MPEPHSYNSIDDAAHGLLVESLSIVEAVYDDLAVIGGWSPYLLDTHGVLKHPGTKDVDLLFSGGASSGDLEDVVRTLLANGYTASAKHAFQLIRVLKVQDVDFAFNVDLLHPLEGTPDAPTLDHAMFVKHVDFGIPLREDYEQFLEAKSIGTINCGLVFTEGLVTRHEVRSIVPTGEERTVKVPLANETAILITKASSMWEPKRHRDAFDVYLAVTQSAEPEQVKAEAARVGTHHPEIFELFSGLQKALSEKASFYDSRVLRFAEGTDTEDLDPSPAERVAHFVGSVLQIIDDDDGLSASGLVIP